MSIRLDIIIVLMLIGIASNKKGIAEVITLALLAVSALTILWLLSFPANLYAYTDPKVAEGPGINPAIDPIIEFLIIAIFCIAPEFNTLE
jgi:hypothetical protein